jgi:zinc transport system permease protein
VSALAALGLPWPFERAYMQLALAAGLVVGATAPLVGVFLVQRRQALMGDGIGHVAFAGVAVGVLAGVAPVWSALAVAVAAALAVEWLRTRGRATGDLALALLFYGGIAAGVVILSKADAGSVSVLPYLFGSILTVDDGDVAVTVGLGFVILATVAVCGRALFAAVLDEESARVAGLPVDGLNALVSVLTAVTVVTAMRVVGILLVAALMIVPVAASRLLATSLRATVGIAAGIGAGSVVLGLVAARAWGLAPGGAIVLAATGAFGLAALRRQQTAATAG